jgi:hypothetical protein
VVKNAFKGREGFVLPGGLRSATAERGERRELKGEPGGKANGQPGGASGRRLQAGGRNGEDAARLSPWMCAREYVSARYVVIGPEADAR